MKFFVSLLLYLTMAICACSQNIWKVDDIADTLTRDAYSVVRTYELNVKASSQKVLTMHYHVVTTILNKKGEEHAAWNYATSNFEKLTSFSGKVYNDQGKVVEKIKMSDVRSSQYSEHLATDTRHNFIEPPVMDYPYTVEYEWEIKATNGYMEYGFFTPIRHDRQSLQHAEFIVSVPSGTSIRHITMPVDSEPQKTVVNKDDQYTWTLPAQRCLIDDSYEDNALYILPSVTAMPMNFVFGDSSGSLESWESLGIWYAQLAEGRGNLPSADTEKIKELTKDCTTDKEKIEVLYNYLANKTRYVSIQLGIGGWQPMKAEEVSKTGFGDCKALTNYMQALLREVGIESYQTIISTEYADLLKGFPNMHQTNHVILTIPQENDSTMVIECTNPQLPLGFVPSSYAGHEALQVKGNESRIIRIADYTPENNYETLKAGVVLHTDGTSAVDFACDHYGGRYASVRSLTKENEKDRKDIVAHWTDLKDPVVKEAVATEVKTPVPHVNVESKMSVTYGEVNGDKIFIQSNPFRHFSVPRFRKERQNPIVVDNAVSLNDEISIELPDGYSYKPGKADESDTTEFGSYMFHAEQEGNLLHVSTKVSINKGHFDISKANDFITFRDKISKIMKRILIIEKD